MNVQFFDAKMMPGLVTPTRSIHNPYKKGKAVQSSVSQKNSADSQVRKDATGTVLFTNRGITPAQRQRMQANKEHALMLLRARQATVDASDGILNEHAVGNVTVTPVKKRNRAVQQELPVKTLFSTVTPEQRERSRANRQSALQLRQEKERCPRCFQSYDKQQLCIVWRHRGQHMAEHPSRSIVCWPCCQRVKSQPCFIGTHIPPGTSAVAASPKGPATTSDSIRCDCGELARLLRCHKAGLNHGRYLYRCWVPFGSPQCNFFHWADQLHGLLYRPTLAPDGVSQWQHLHADPFDEDLACPRAQPAVVRREQTRERLIAACLVKQMVMEASSGEFLQSLQTEEELRRAVNQVMSSGSAVVVGHLHPLTGAQIQQRFGYDGGVNGVTAPVLAEEFKSLLDKLLETNQVLRATVRRIDSSWLDLQCLGNYFKI